MIAYDYPLLSVFWTMLVLFLWISWFMLLFRVLGDILTSHDLGGVAKALWTIFVILLPFLGTLVYLVARGGSMVQRDVERADQRDQAFQAYVRQAAASGTGTADELRKLADLKDQGVLTEAEFAQRKAVLLA